METLLENIIELAEKVWIKLDILLDLENMELPEFLEPLLASILSDPLLLGISAAMILLIPLGIYKLKKAHAEKEGRLNALLNELDETEDHEEMDENDPARLRKKPAEPTGYDEPDVDTLSKLEEKDTDDDDDEDVYERYKKEYEMGGDEEEGEGVYGDEFESSTSPEEATISKETEDLDHTLREIVGDDLNWNEESTTVTSELAEDLIDVGSDKDQTILDLQAEIEESIQALTESLSQDTSPPLPATPQLETTDIDLDKDAEKVREEEPTAESSLEEAQEPAPEIEEEPSVESIQEENPELEEVIILDLEQMLETEKENEEELDEPEQKETTAPSAEVADIPTQPTSFYEEPPEEIEGSEILGQNTIESKEESSTAFIEASSEISQEDHEAEPLETRSHSLDIEPVIAREKPGSEPARKERSSYQPTRVRYKSKRESRSNKEYVNLLESFIFMAKQKNKKSDS